MRLPVGKYAPPLLFPLFKFEHQRPLSADRLRVALSPVPFAYSATVLFVTVVRFTDSEKLITICPLVPIPVAPSVGVTPITVGATTSSVAAVVKLLLKLDPVPRPGRIALSPTVTLILALPGSARRRRHRQRRPVHLNVPATCSPFARIAQFPVLTFTGLIGSLKVTVTGVVTATPVARSADSPPSPSAASYPPRRSRLS